MSEKKKKKRSDLLDGLANDVPDHVREAMDDINDRMTQLGIHDQDMFNMRDVDGNVVGDTRRLHPDRIEERKKNRKGK
jgi:hypothetical protein